MEKSKKEDVIKKIDEINEDEMRILLGTTYEMIKEVHL